MSFRPTMSQRKPATTQGETDMGSAEAQGRLWGAAAKDWSEITEYGQVPFYEAAFDAINIEPGTRLLDAGCGSGLALQLAAKRGATVSGLDASEGLLAVARSRVPDSDIRQGDLESLPFDDHSFDAVTAFNSVQYAESPEVALREIKRVAKVGSPVAIVTWGEADQCETRVILAAIGGLLPPPPPGAGGPFALSAPGALEALVERAGLTAEHAILVPTPYEYPDLDTAVKAQLASGPARRAIEHAGLDATREALTEAFVGARQPDGTYLQHNVFKVLVARA
jgi:SAM-dependent methyltransferase